MSAGLPVGAVRRAAPGRPGAGSGAVCSACGPGPHKGVDQPGAGQPVVPLAAAAGGCWPGVTVVGPATCGLVQQSWLPKPCMGIFLVLQS